METPKTEAGRATERVMAVVDELLPSIPAGTYNPIYSAVLRELTALETRKEIKPAGLDRSDPTTELRRAYINTLDGLLGDLLGKDFGEGKTSADHLRWMAREILNNIRTMPADKMGRWVGFIQGVMAANGVLDVDAERDRTRAFFNLA